MGKEPPEIKGSDPMSTAAQAAQVAEKMRLEQEKARAKAASSTAPPPLHVVANPSSDSKAPPALGMTAFDNQTRKKTDQEIDLEARQKAEESLANLDEDKRKKLLPNVIAKLKAKIKAEQEGQQTKPAAPKPPPPQEKKPAAPVLGAVPATLPSVPGIIGLPEGAQPAPSMVSKSMEALQAAKAAKAPMASAIEADRLAAEMMGRPPTLQAVMGTFTDEFEINDY